MNQATKRDLEDLTLILEDLVKRMPKLKLAELVDLGARTRAVAKHAETIDDFVKGLIKAKAKGKPTTVPGEIFKANVNVIPTTRLDVTMLKIQYPVEHAVCSKTNNEMRITFEAR